MQRSLYRELQLPMPLQDIIFYDAGCGFCQRMVMYVLHRDTRQRFMFAPRPGQSFDRLIDEPTRSQLPASVVVLTRNGRVLVRSEAVLHIQRELGGFERVLARVAGIVPALVRNGVYNMIARVRRHLVPARACMKLSPQDQVRFLE